MNCKECKKEFEATRSFQIFCCIKCSRRFHSKQQAEHKKNFNKASGRQEADIKSGVSKEDDGEWLDYSGFC